MRLIDADALKTTMDECIYSDRDRFSTGYAKSFIDDAPTVDAEPVVRCGECKWFQANMMSDGYLPKGVPEYECRHWCGATDPTDYCSYGERKGGDE